MHGRRRAFVHTAQLALQGDERAVGAAVTVEVCGHWEHGPPCRVPHRTDVLAGPDAVAVRVLFACEPAHEGEVRSGIERALHAGELTVPAPDDGPGTRWQVLSSAAGELEAGDQPVAARLAAGG